jgi:hypothetical protein
MSSITNVYPLPDVSRYTSSKGYATNNQYKGVPPKMSDSRALVASWQPQSEINGRIIQENNLKSNWQYRRYMMDNADAIRECNAREAYTDVGYYEPYQDNNGQAVPKSSNKPYIYTSFSDNSMPIGYQTSDLKQLYLSREELNSRKFVATISTNQSNHQ